MQRGKISIIVIGIFIFQILIVKGVFSAPKVIPIEDFFENPKVTSFQLSPDGKQVAFIQPYQGRLSIFIKFLEEKEAQCITKNINKDIYFFYWKNKDTIIYLQDQDGDENFHLYCIDLKTGESKDLTPFKGVRVGLVDALANAEQEMLIFMNKENQEVFDVYRLNLQTGSVRLEVKNPGNYTGYVTDNQGLVRIACGKDTKTGDKVIYYRSNSKEPFRRILSCDYRDTFEPYFFTSDNKKIYAISTLGRDKKALVVANLEEDMKEQVIYAHSDVDIRGIAYSAKQKAILGVSYVTDRVHAHFFDKREAAFYHELHKKLGDCEISIVSEDQQEERFILLVHSDRISGIYYFYDTKTKKLQEMGRLSTLEEKQLAAMRPIQYRARDGMTIHGYLTLPQGMKEKNVPLIVYPHGGPWERDTWGYQADVQFLANRGYAVLQMNFRGSVGYGKEFLNAGNKEWGKKMQDDITDGVRWAIHQGIANPNKIGIYGSSYGGYAVLSGLTRTPELYACGIDLCGPSNLFTLLDSLPAYWRPNIKEFYERVGNPKLDAKLLQEVSPLFHVDKIRAPLLIGQGKNDPRVKVTESDQMVIALQNKGVPVTYILKENEGHGFQKEENRIEFYRAMEHFLEKNLKE